MFDITQWSKDEELWALLRYLTQKDYPYESDKEKMLSVLMFLADNELLGLSIIQKLSEITYTTTSISIDGISFSRNNLTPVDGIEWIAVSKWLKANPEKTIFQTQFQWKDEYYFTAQSYLDQCLAQDKIPIMESHLRRIMSYFPWKFVDNSDYLWGNLLWLLLNLNFSWGIEDQSFIRFAGVYGCLASWTINKDSTSLAYWFNMIEWWIFWIFNETFARPWRCIIA